MRGRTFAVTSPVPRAEWESLFRSDQNAVVGQSPAWRDAIFADGRYRDVSLLYEFSSGNQVVLPMAQWSAHQHSRLLPSWPAVMSSWPRIWGVGGPLSRGGSVSPDEAAAVLADVAGRGALEAKITLRHDADPAWLSEARQFRVEEVGCHILDLAGGFDHVWQHVFRSAARTAVRKAERSGLDIEVDRCGRLLNVFYDLREKSIGQLAAERHESLWSARRRMALVGPTSLGQLATVARHFGEDCVTWVARLKGEPVAATIVLKAGTNAKGWRRTMDKNLAAPVRANELLDRLAIEDACQGGCRFFDLGGSPPGSSLAKYKEKFGATPGSTHELRAASLPVHTAWRLSRHLIKMTGLKAF